MPNFLTGVIESQLLNDSAPKDFEPFPLVEDFYLETRGREGKVSLDPTDLKRRISCSSAKKFQEEAVDRELEVEGDEFRVCRIMSGLGRVRRGYVGDVLDDDVRLVEVSTERFIVRFDLLNRSLVCLEYAGTLHLMKDGIVRRINFVSSVNIGGQ